MNRIEQGLDLIARAYAEDLAAAGDVTSQATIDPGHTSVGHVVARNPGCLSGLEIVRQCFQYIDPSTTVDSIRADGDLVDADSVLMTVGGTTLSLLAAERVALNLLGRLSGIATATRSFVDAVAGTGAAVSDTRKTTPGMRWLEKQAVLDGGGINHRFGLYDAVLIKDNHIVAAGSIRQAIDAARSALGPETKVEVEVDTLVQLEDVVAAGADAVLLDNMAVGDLARAVSIVGGTMVTEASGGVDLTTIRAIAETGVDVVSIGWITHSAPSLDVAFDLVDDG